MGFFDDVGKGITNNPVSRALGLSGEQGAYFQPAATPLYDPTAMQDAESRGMMSADPRAATALSDYGRGNISLADAMGQGMGLSSSPGAYDQFQSNLATDPVSGSRFATDQVQSNPLLSSLYGRGGQLDKATNEADELASRGYSLKPEDNEAYGQASDNIARLSGQQEKGLSQALSDRGLGTGASGASGAMFSGVQGNKFEALAQAQTDIAQRRMDMNQQRLNATRSYVSQLGGQAEGAIQDQYGRQLAGAKQGTDQRNALLNAVGNKYNSDIASYKEQNDANQKSIDSMYDRKGKTIFDAIGTGIYQGVSGSASGAVANGAKGLGSSGGAGAGATGAGAAVAV